MTTPLAELKAMAESASPGLWDWQFEGRDAINLFYANTGVKLLDKNNGSLSEERIINNARYIIALVNSFGDIVKRLETAEKKTEAAEVLVREVEGMDQEDGSLLTDAGNSPFSGGGRGSKKFDNEQGLRYQGRNKANVLWRVKRDAIIARYRAATGDKE